MARPPQIFAWFPQLVTLALDCAAKFLAVRLAFRRRVCYSGSRVKRDQGDPMRTRIRQAILTLALFAAGAIAASSSIIVSASFVIVMTWILWEIR